MCVEKKIAMKLCFGFNIFKIKYFCDEQFYLIKKNIMNNNIVKKLCDQESL